MTPSPTYKVKWRPIATAPKDGSRILSRNYYTQFVQWKGRAWITDFGDTILPIYWLPLPAPPGPPASDTEKMGDAHKCDDCNDTGWITDINDQTSPPEKCPCQAPASPSPSKEAALAKNARWWLSECSRLGELVSSLQADNKAAQLALTTANHVHRKCEERLQQELEKERKLSHNNSRNLLACVEQRQIYEAQTGATITRLRATLETALEELNEKV